MVLKQLRERGFLDKPAFYPLSGGISIEVPISRFTNCWDQEDVDGYEQEFIETLCRFVRQLQPPVTLIDAGADIGVLSLKVASKCSSVERIIAFEPNAESYPWLKRNLDRLPYPALALANAVSDFEGRGALTYPNYDPESAHACYLEPSPDGPIEVVTIDSVHSPSAMEHDLVLKLDLEGGEPAALRGAVRTLREARNVVVALEAHPSVVKRTGVDPVESLRFLRSIREFQFVAGETRETVTVDRPVFEQIPPDRIYNIIGRTSGEAPVSPVHSANRVS
jgi:FkbM family methyltransferase